MLLPMWMRLVSCWRLRIGVQMQCFTCVRMTHPAGGQRQEGRRRQAVVMRSLVAARILAVMAIGQDHGCSRLSKVHI